MMNGLAPQTTEVFERITRLTCIQPFVLVRGTALSLQLNKRQSEDLDFMCWKRSFKDKSEVPISAIKQEIHSVAEVLRSVITIGQKWILHYLTIFF